MGSGDWNDGMNRVGAEGRGESVWLGWFLCRLVADFAPWAHARGDTLRAQRWERAALGWQAALLGPAWDGHWFKRAFFDDGSPLGSQANTEARIDLIAQAWSVLSGAAPPEMQRMALDAMETLLVDTTAGHQRPCRRYRRGRHPGSYRRRGRRHCCRRSCRVLPWRCWHFRWINCPSGRCSASSTAARRFAKKPEFR